MKVGARFSKTPSMIMVLIGLVIFKGRISIIFIQVSSDPDTLIKLWSFSSTG